MRGVLRAETLWVETFTGLRMDRFVKLVKVVRERGGNGPGGGRPWALPLAERVLLVAVYYRTNLTMRQLAPLFGVCPATVCRVIHRLRPLLALEPAPRPLTDTDRLWIVDGTLIPVRDRGVGASSRNYRFSANVQVIIDADTRLVIATARPVPGNKADAHAWRESDLPAKSAGVTVLADGAYWGTGLVVPHRKRANRPLLRGQEEDNAAHRKVRARVEHTFARMKNWKILRDCRQKGPGLHHAVQAVATMHNLALAG
ncbi:transposase family protein [Streptomyces sp. NPDC091272]|uniref:transposase family protein n=1 Tax=Streptomyces sp. NPDC091272 TaxID=3365981 RepID=UPI0037F9FE8F